MMNKKSIVITILTISICLKCFGEKTNNIDINDDIVNNFTKAIQSLQDVTNILKEQVRCQETLLQNIKDYSSSWKEFHRDPRDPFKAKELVGNANRCFREIQSLNIEHIFPKEFLEEIQTLSALSDEKKI